MTSARCLRRLLRSTLPLILAGGCVAGGCAIAPLPALGQNSLVGTDAARAVSADASFGQLNSTLEGAAIRLLHASASGPVLHAPTVQAKQPAQQRHTPVPPKRAALRSLVASPSAGSRALRRIEQLRPMMEPILRQQGLPDALLAVALIESGGQFAALSPKGARGLWQLMPETARRYGLTVSGAQDDRLNPVLSTRAAARYLHDLHEEFGDWQLALAAYNAGEQAVETAIEHAGSNDFAVLSQMRLLPAETRLYVPQVLLASRAFGPLTSEGTESGESRAPGRVVFASAALLPTLPTRGEEATISGHASESRQLRRPASE